MKLIIVLFVSFLSIQTYSQEISLADSTKENTPSVEETDSIDLSNIEILDPDNLVRLLGFKNDSTLIEDSIKNNQHKADSIENELKHIVLVMDSINLGIKHLNEVVDSVESISQVGNVKQIEKRDVKTIIEETPLLEIDSLILQNNFFFIDLVYRDSPLTFNWEEQLEPYSYFYNHKSDSIQSILNEKFEVPSVEQIIADLREDTYRSNMLRSPAYYAYRADELPSLEGLQSRIIESINVERMKLESNLELNKYVDSKLQLNDIKLRKWTKKANTMIQFSQNYVSKNWHQGGSQYISILGILSGRLNYDNKKNIQWDNSGEWRLGFNSTEDAIRKLNTNEDVFKINSKFGLRASGNLFYSSSLDLSAQLFNNYNSPTSEVLNAAFLTPVRLNIGVGLDYKYKKLISMMLSPLSFKYVYSNDSRVSPTRFGIPEGENSLKQIGSSFRAQLSYAPNRNIQLDSKLSFYTNYEKIEVDWEIVGNFAVNRYLSTRISLNPRYDTSVILPTGEKAQLQFKELLSFGFSYRLLN